jgi:hypothetical protein
MSEPLPPGLRCPNCSSVALASYSTRKKLSLAENMQRKAPKVFDTELK